MYSIIIIGIIISKLSYFLIIYFYSITNLNMGGALTGPPATQRQPSTAVGQTVSVVLPLEDTKERYWL